MGIHSELEALGAALLVRRTKVLYGAIALMLFGALGICVQLTDASAQAAVATTNSASIAPALSDACRDSKFVVGHTEACSAAAKITADPTKPAGVATPAPSEVAFANLTTVTPQP